MDGISVIIITYNRSAELVYTLELLKNQDYSKKYEVIIVDQGSKDDTQQKIKEFAWEKVIYKRIEKNLGVAGGRNLGASLASYNNMVFIDDDAHFVKNSALSQIYELMKNDQHQIFAFRIYDIKGGLYNWPYGKKKLLYSNEYFECNKYIGCGHAIKKDFFDSVEGYSNEMYFMFEETELVMKLFSRNHKPVLYCGDIELVHRVTPTSRIIPKDRFYYKVRNRLYTLRELHPIGGGFVTVYYMMGYLFRAVTYNMIPEYLKGIRDSYVMKIDKKWRMSYRNFIRYWRAK